MSSLSLNFLPSASVSGDNFMLFINTAIWVGIVMFVVTIGAAIYWALKYKRKGANDEGAYQPGNYLVEFTSIFLISIWVAVFFLWGWHDYSYVITPRMNEYEVNIIGQQWQWTTQYADGKSYTNEVYLEVNKPVKFIITAKDVLHSFYIPEFRIKQDAVPGQFTTLHATPTRWVSTTSTARNTAAPPTPRCLAPCTFFPVKISRSGKTASTRLPRRRKPA